MKDKVKTLKAALAIIFADMVEKTQPMGITFKYNSGPIEEEGQKGWRFAIEAHELAYPARTIQEWKFLRPDNIDIYNMEYNVLMVVFSAMTETSLLTWNELGKQLNVDPSMQKAARESLK
jgi:hypothetical protein